MKIVVLGAGWYGCHLSRVLLQKGHDVTIYDRTGIFAAASGHNQDRIHQGFHYPRSHKTRSEIAYCHDRFVNQYPVCDVANNLYAVANSSLIDFQTYQTICSSIRLTDEDVRHTYRPDFISVDPESYGMCNVEGALLTTETVVDTPAAARTFRMLLGKHLRIANVMPESHPHYVTVDGENFDVCLNCTNLRIPCPQLPTFYEAAMVLEVRGPAHNPSLTIMDGPTFPALLGTPEPGIYTLSAVHLTAMHKCSSFEEAQHYLNGVNWSQRAPAFMDAMEHFRPGFRGEFIPVGARLAVRTKPVNATDSRECLTHVDGRIMTVSCGKFASVYVAQERVEEWLKNLGE